MLASAEGLRVIYAQVRVHVHVSSQDMTQQSELPTVFGGLFPIVTIEAIFIDSEAPPMTSSG